MIIYDISSRATAIESLMSLLKLSKEELFSIKFKYSIKDFVEKFNDKVKMINPDEIRYAVIHITTNEEVYKSISNHGIYRLNHLLANDTKLKRFLAEHGIYIDIDEKKLSFNGSCYNITSDNYLYNNQGSALVNLYHKLYREDYINGFMYISDINNYSVITEYPEILDNLSYFNSKLIVDWKQEASQPYYIVKFTCKWQDFEKFPLEDQSDSIMIHLLKCALLDSEIFSEDEQRGYGSYEHLYFDQSVAMIDLECINPKNIIRFYSKDDWLYENDRGQSWLLNYITSDFDWLK